MKYDCIVIGAGHNGLIAAAKLAKFGLKKILVLEKSSFLGGCVRTNSNIFPGYKVDTGTQVLHQSLLRIGQELELQRFGLEVVHPSPKHLWLLGENVEIGIHEDVEATCQEIAKYSKEEADNYRRLVQAWAPLMGQIEAVSHAPEMTYTQFIQVLESLGTNAMRLFLGRASNILRTYFSTDWMPGAMGRGILTLRVSPQSPTTGYSIMFALRSHWAPAWRPKGGMEGFINPLAKMIQHYGGEVHRNSGVRKIIIEDGRAKGVRLESGEEIEADIIVSSAHFRVTYFDLVGEEHLKPDFVAFLKGLVLGYGDFGVFLALDQEPETTGGHIILTRGLTEVEEAYDAISKGKAPEHAALFIGNPCPSDPSLAPPRRYWLSIVGHTPYELEGTTWAAETERYAENLIEITNRRIPNIKRHIVDRFIQTPLDLERDYNLPGADLHGPPASFDQMYTLRPSLRSPIKNLYISGTAVHPGGGSSGAPGRNVATVIIEDLQRK